MTHEYTLDGQRYDQVVARPSGPGPHPVVLVCHAWSGRSDLEEARAHELAALGYVGVAVDLYGVGRRGTDRASCAALMGELTSRPSELRARLQRAHREATRLPGVDASRSAILGFCFGGLCAILAARMGLPLRGAISVHGLLKIGEPLPGPVQSRILILHGQDDPMVPTADVTAFAEEMKRIDADWELHAYSGVMHAFSNPAADDPDFGTVYHAEADRRSRRAIERFLADALEA